MSFQPRTYRTSTTPTHKHTHKSHHHQATTPNPTPSKVFSVSFSLRPQRECGSPPRRRLQTHPVPGESRTSNNPPNSHISYFFHCFFLNFIIFFFCTLNLHCLFFLFLFFYLLLVKHKTYSCLTYTL
jgi:hypothetical protein